MKSPRTPIGKIASNSGSGFFQPSQLSARRWQVGLQGAWRALLSYANGRDEAKCSSRLDRLRAAVRDAGLGEMCIGCGVMGHEAIPKEHWASRVFDFTATYMDLPGKEQKKEDEPFATLEEFTEQGRLKHINDAIPYMPYLAAGWNPRPWPDKRACFTFPTQDEWKQALEKMKGDLAHNPALGLPGGIKAFTIYAWNEFGEGGIVAPTVDEKMKLEGIRNVFGRR